MTEPTGQDCPRCHRRGNRVWSRWALWAPVSTFTTDFMTDVGQVLRNEDGSSHQESARRPRASGSHGHVGRGRKEDVQARGTLLRAQERRGGVCGPPPGPRVCACARVRVCAHVHVCAHVCVSLTACFLSVPALSSATVLNREVSGGRCPGLNGKCPVFVLALYLKKTG